MLHIIMTAILNFWLFGLSSKAAYSALNKFIWSIANRNVMFSCFHTYVVEHSILLTSERRRSLGDLGSLWRTVWSLSNRVRCSERLCLSSATWFLRRVFPLESSLSTWSWRDSGDEQQVQHQHCPTLKYILFNIKLMMLSNVLSNNN